MRRIIAPSILSADFGHLDRAVRMLDRSSAEWVHVDVMDGRVRPQHFIRVSRAESRAQGDPQAA